MSKTTRNGFLFYLLGFGLSWLTSLKFIQYHVAGFYKPPIPQSPPSHLRDYSTCNNARLEFFHNFCSKLWNTLTELRPKHFKMNKFLDGVILLVRPPLYLLNSWAWLFKNKKKFKESIFKEDLDHGCTRVENPGEGSVRFLTKIFGEGT